MMEAHFFVIIDRWGKCRLSAAPLNAGNDGIIAGLPQALGCGGIAVWGIVVWGSCGEGELQCGEVEIRGSCAWGSCSEGMLQCGMLQCRG